MAAGALRAFAARTLPAYMVPVFVVPITAVPLTRNGKIDYAVLPSPEETIDPVSEAPVGPIQLQLAGIWQALLGATHDFLERGGSSLLLLQLQLRIRSEFGVLLSIAALARHSTLALMSAAIARALQDAAAHPIAVRAPASVVATEPAAG